MSLQQIKLPHTPPLFEKLQAEKSKLEKQNRLLKDVVEVLYIQNQQLSSCLNSRKIHDREQRARLERLTQCVKELSSNQSRHRQSIKKSDEERREAWKEFCREKTAEAGGQLWEYLDTLSDKILDKQYEEMITESLCEEIVIGIKGHELTD